MNTLEKGLCITAGGLALTALAALLAEEKEEAEEKTAEVRDEEPSLDDIVKSVKCDAEAAYGACRTDDERAEVFQKLTEQIEQLKQILGEKCEKIFEIAEKRTKIPQSEEEIEGFSRRLEIFSRMENIRGTVEGVKEGLDEVILKLSGEAAGCTERYGEDEE
ncbi:MAG: hypothetical protein HUJ86_04360 [Synergistes sp.]|nr:hypothetical protein [Synergistes sp.]